MNVVTRPATSPPATRSSASKLRPEPLARLHPAQLHRPAAAGADRPRRAERRHLQPGHLREGDGARHRLRRGLRSWPRQRRPSTRSTSTRRWRSRTSRHACDMMRPVYERDRQGATATSASRSRPTWRCAPTRPIAEARRLWKWVGRAEPDGQGARHRGGRAGDPHADLARGSTSTSRCCSRRAPMRRWRRRSSPGWSSGSPRAETSSGIASVASFFVSRIDTVIDKKIDERGQGRRAGAGASCAARSRSPTPSWPIRHYLSWSRAPRWQKLGRSRRAAAAAAVGEHRRQGQGVQRRDVRRGADRPRHGQHHPAGDDGRVPRPRQSAREPEEDVEGARRMLEEAEQAGLDLAAVTTQLVDRRREAVRRGGRQAAGRGCGQARGDAGRPARQGLGEAARRLAEGRGCGVRRLAQASGKLRDLWAGEAKVWTGADEAQWLGWLRHRRDALTQQLPELQAFQDEIKREGFQHCLLLGMGGSSLGPEVLAETFGQQPGFPELLILDSTDPAQIKALRNRLDLKKTLSSSAASRAARSSRTSSRRISASEMKKAVGEQAGRHFVAVTDPGSKMRAGRARRTGSGACSSATRRSAAATRCCPISAWCPAAAMGLDLRAFLEHDGADGALLRRRHAAEGEPGRAARAAIWARRSARAGTR